MPVSQPGATSAGPEAALDRIEKAHDWFLHRLPTTMRRRLGIAIVAVAVVLAAPAVIVPALNTVTEVAIELANGLDVVAYAGLAIMCWVGSGGALVPIPGVRTLSWVLIVQQGAALEPLLVAVLAAAAMSLGQSSYFAATRAGERHRADPHHHHVPGRGADRPAADGAAVAAGASSDAPAGRRQRIVHWSRALLTRARAAIVRLMRSHPQRVILLVSIVPNPLTTYATVTAAATGLTWSRFLAPSFAGFLVLTLALVSVGQAILAAIGLT